MTKKYVVYSHPKCTTCKKALAFLDDHQVEYEIKDITKTAPSLEELKKMAAFKEGNLKKLLNTSGMLYREMELSKKSATMKEAELLALLSKEGMLVKRPFLLTKDFGLTGFNEKEWLEKLRLCSKN